MGATGAGATLKEITAVAKKCRRRMVKAEPSRDATIQALNSWYEETLLADAIYGRHATEDEEDPRYAVAVRVRDWIKQNGLPITSMSPDRGIEGASMTDRIRELNQLAESCGLYFGGSSLDDQYYIKDKRGWGM